MLNKETSLALLTALIDLVEAAVPSPTYSFCLLTDELTDPPRHVRWEDIMDFEASYSGYARQNFLKTDIVGPESWAEGHYLRFPQTNFPTASAGTPIRWLAIVAFGEFDARILALEKLGTVWDPSAVDVPLQHVCTIRTRIAVP